MNRRKVTKMRVLLVRKCKKDYRTSDLKKIYIAQYGSLAATTDPFGYPITFDNSSLEHIYPISLGGTDEDLENVMLISEAANKAKNNCLKGVTNGYEYKVEEKSTCESGIIGKITISKKYKDGINLNKRPFQSLNRDGVGYNVGLLGEPERLIKALFKIYKLHTPDETCTLFILKLAQHYKFLREDIQLDKYIRRRVERYVFKKRRLAKSYHDLKNCILGLINNKTARRVFEERIQKKLDKRNFME
jgi:hypothetical protein